MISNRKTDKFLGNYINKQFFINLLGEQLIYEGIDN